MKNRKLMLISIVASMVLIAMLSNGIGKWIHYSDPKYYSKEEKISMRFEEIQNPKQNRRYHRKIIHYYVTKRDGFLSVITEEVNTIDKGIFSNKR